MNRTGRARLHMGCGESLYSRWRTCGSIGDEPTVDRQGHAVGRPKHRAGRPGRKQRCTH